MPSYNATAIVLHRTDLGENDRTLTLFTREKGKVSAIAKGSRRGSSRLSGATELFMQARLQLATGRTLDIVTQCEIQHSFSGLRLDLHRLARATYFCELLDRFTGERDETAGPELYDITTSALQMLLHAGDYPDAVVHAYELKLLALLGYAPVLDRCVVCGAAAAGRAAGFSPSLGGVVCAQDRYRSNDGMPLSMDALETLQSLERGGEEVVLGLNPTAAVAAEVAKALRWFVRFRSERALKSADFLDQLRAAP